MQARHADFAQRTRDTFGARGEAWLDDLPTLLTSLAQRWRLTLGPTFPLTYNYVVAAQRADGSEAVLKLGVPHPGLAREIQALEVYGGRGACLVLEVDADRGAVLLERLWPGESLVETARIDDAEATGAAARVMRSLWRPAPRGGSFVSLAEWFRSFERHRAVHAGSSPLPAAVFEHAARLAQRLLTSGPAPLLLHGDLHHTNILSATRQPWLAIDPKGVVGDPGYEVGPFLINPHDSPAPQSAEALARRLDAFADVLGYDRDRLRDWGIAHAVLSACWSLEDHGRGWEAAIATAEILLGL